MLVGLAGLLSGYDGWFEFKSGEAYPESVICCDEGDVGDVWGGYGSACVVYCFGVGDESVGVSFDCDDGSFRCVWPFFRSLVADDDGVIDVG